MSRYIHIKGNSRLYVIRKIISFTAIQTGKLDRAGGLEFTSYEQLISVQLQFLFGASFRFFPASMISARAIRFSVATVLPCYLLLQASLQWNHNTPTEYFQLDGTKENGILRQQLLEINSSTQIPEFYYLQRFRSRDISTKLSIKEKVELGQLVQRSIIALQNPAECDNARKLLCTVDNQSGFGCITHHIIYCLMTAYSTNRTLVLNLKVRYEGPSWNEIFLPVSNTCHNSSGSSYGTWGGGGTNISAQVLTVGTFDTMTLNPPWETVYPAAVPLGISSRLERVSSHPVMWWVGHFATYVLRPRRETEKIINNAKAMMNENFLKNPISNVNFIRIGVHVRRTDKLISEAKSYPLEKYLWHVEEYIKALEKIEGHSYMGHAFLASDEPKVIQETRKLGNQTRRWKVLANESIANVAENVNQRFKNGMLPILLDVMLLAKCEFVVCTFSSNICRLVAELKEVNIGARGEVVSLDHPFYFIPFQENTIPNLKPKQDKSNFYTYFSAK